MTYLSPVLLPLPTTSGDRRLRRCKGSSACQPRSGPSFLTSCLLLANGTRLRLNYPVPIPVHTPDDDAVHKALLKLLIVDVCCTEGLENFSFHFASILAASPHHTDAERIDYGAKTVEHGLIFSFSFLERVDDAVDKALLKLLIVNDEMDMRERAAHFVRSGHARNASDGETALDELRRVARAEPELYTGVVALVSALLGVVQSEADVTSKTTVMAFLAAMAERGAGDGVACGASASAFQAVLSVGNALEVSTF
ncbi:hypothetical protein K488DRAFT_84998 [Vararia minispora EC-137]|uniref:Uncharacterized protein n=1 Tax=Vararia minispora EC-137 TaxID=1314806 RepID=A0ACB8QPJ0_9AGAM|nr:hypothetical protein K488DRAFT_84998 [Vararia minispora EC-137]